MKRIWYVIGALLLINSPSWMGFEFSLFDTLDVNTMQFIYASDALRSGHLALWNPFVLSGLPIVPNMWNFSLLSPIDLVSLVASTLIDPLAVFEMQTVLALIVLALSLRHLLRHFQVDDNIASLGGLVLALAATHRLHGQVMNIWSFALWFLLLAFTLSISTKLWRASRLFFCSFVVAAIWAKSYYFYIAMGLGCCLVFLVWQSLQQSRGGRLSFLFTRGVQLGLLCLPGLAFWAFGIYDNIQYVHQTYAGFAGDLIMDPGLRKFAGHAPQYTDGAMHSFLRLISLADDEWFSGARTFSFFLVLGVVCLFRAIKKDGLKNQALLLILFGLGIFFYILSFKNPLADFLFYYVPPFSTFRWQFALMPIVLLFFGLGSLTALERAPWFGQWQRWLAVGLFAVIFSFHNMKFKQPTSEIPWYHQRKIDVSVTENFREPNTKAVLDGQYRGWLEKKVPFIGGYFPAVSEHYHRLQKYPFLQKLASISCRFQEETPIVRSQFQTDQDYMTAWQTSIPQGSDVFLASVENDQPCGPSDSAGAIDSLKLEPNSFSINLSVARPAVVAAFQQTYNGGWSVLVDGSARELLRVNRLFMGVAVQPGDSHVQFVYWPRAFTWILLWYGVMILMAGYFVIHLIVRRKAGE